MKFLLHIRVKREREDRERETEQVTFVLIKCTKENEDSLYIENGKKQGCKEQLIKIKHL